MKANHLRSIAVLTVLAAAFLWFVLSYGQVSAYEDPVVCWDGSHKYLNRGLIHREGIFPDVIRS